MYNLEKVWPEVQQIIDDLEKNRTKFVSFMNIIFPKVWHDVVRSN